MISVILPVYNEESVLESSIKTLMSFFCRISEEYELIIVSNGSTDRTNEIALSLQRQFQNVRYFHLSARSVGMAFVKGVQESAGDRIISLDIDLSSEIEFIEYAINLLHYADMVVGSKTMGNQKRSTIRILASQIYILFTQLLFDLTISDYSIGCKAYRKNAILGALPHLDNWTGYVFELCVYLRQRNARIIQIGIDCNDNRKSHFNLLHEGFYRYYHLFRVWFKLKTGKFWISEK